MVKFTIFLLLSNPPKRTPLNIITPILVPSIYPALKFTSLKAW